MSIKTGSLVSTVAFAILFPSSAMASVIYTQSLSASPIGQYSKADGQQEASQFTLASSSTITGATFFGAPYGGSLPANFTIQFFSSVNNLPGVELFNQTVSGSPTSTGVMDNLGNTVQAITVAFAPFAAAAGVSYFFGAADVSGKAYNFVVDSSGSGIGAQTEGGIAGFYSLKTAEAYTLTGPTIEGTGGVPEPATWAMMILGLGAVGFAMRRRQQAQVRFAF